MSDENSSQYLGDPILFSDIDLDYILPRGDWDVTLKSEAGNFYTLRFTLIKSTRLKDFLLPDDKLIQVNRIK